MAEKHFLLTGGDQAIVKIEEVKQPGKAGTVTVYPLPSPFHSGMTLNLRCIALFLPSFGEAIPVFNI
ncbi:MAG: hypothetical protein ACOY40_11320 [Bacillota bacterium]